LITLMQKIHSDTAVRSWRVSFP